MTQDQAVEIEGRLTKLETQMIDRDTAIELELENRKEWRIENTRHQDEILDAVKLQSTELRDHVTDSAKVPGYQGNGGVIVISKKWIISTVLAIAGVAGTFISVEFQLFQG